MVTWQLTIDCADPAAMVRFWAPVLGYVVQPPPAGHTTWNDYYLSLGVPAEELDLTADGSDRLADPSGAGPTIWFQPVPEAKQGKNRLHFDVYLPAGGRRSGELADEIERRVAELEAAGAGVLRRYPADFPEADVPGHYAVMMSDPDGNEFCVSAR
jgi:catechol 2,3-dioxygenase-like lactoylglutathione lyase family enzyme